MSRRGIDPNTLRFLYGKSGNKCAFPGCCEPIFEEDGTLTGECCHIEAYSANGPRYNPNTTIEQKNSEANLIMLCSRHHKIVDTHPQKYTVECLTEFKHNHELKYSRETRALNEKMLFSLVESMRKYWIELQDIDKKADNHLKMPININVGVESLMSVLIDFFDEFEGLIQHLRYDDATIMDDLQELCEVVGVDYSKFNDVSYYENPLWCRSWELLNLGFPNMVQELKLIFLQLCVKVLEELSLRDRSYIEHLEKYKTLLKEYHECNYYND